MPLLAIWNSNQSGLERSYYVKAYLFHEAAGKGTGCSGAAKVFAVRSMLWQSVQAEM